MLLPAVVSGWLLSLDDVIVSFFVTGPPFEILPPTTATGRFPDRCGQGHPGVPEVLAEAQKQELI
jgi:hypothetical protein